MTSFGNAASSQRFDTIEKLPSKNSPADKWNNCAFDDKRMKLGTHVKHMQLSIFSYRAISDWSRDPYGRSLSK